MQDLIISILLQFIFFVPFYLLWRRDCIKIGKDHLAVSLWERFMCWLVCFPMWLIGLLHYFEKL